MQMFIIGFFTGTATVTFLVDYFIRRGVGTVKGSTNKSE